MKRIYYSNFMNDHMNNYYNTIEVQDKDLQRSIKALKELGNYIAGIEEI